MNHLLDRATRIPITRLHVAIVILGVLVAARVQYMQHGWINNDSAIYLESSRLMLAGRWREAVQVYPWPFYSWLVASIAWTLRIGTYLAAQVLNVLCFALATGGFVSLIRLLGGRQLEMLAGALILFSSQYLVGDVLGMLLRDEGFWAFYLLGLVFLIRYCRQHRLRDAALWQASILVAMLFRVEAASFAVFLPLAVLLVPGHSAGARLRGLAVSYVPGLLAAGGLLLLVEFQDLPDIGQLGRLRELAPAGFFAETARHFAGKAQLMSDQVLGRYLDDFAVPGLLLTLAYVVVAKLASATGVFTLAMAGAGIARLRARFDTPARVVLSLAATLGLINAALIATKTFALPSRHVAAVSWALMAFAALFLADFTRNYPRLRRERRWLAAACPALLVIVSLGMVKNILPLPAGHAYMRDAALWLNTYNEKDAPVQYGNSRLRFYAGAPFVGFYDEHSPPPAAAPGAAAPGEATFVILDCAAKKETHPQCPPHRPADYREIKRFPGVRNRNFVVIYEQVKR